MATATATGIDVAEPDLAVEDLGGGDREHARAAADVEDSAWPPALEQAVEMQKAAPRRAVMAGAEGEPRLDLDRHVVRPDARAIVAPVNEKPPRPNGFQAGKRIGDPVPLLREAEGRGARGSLVRGGRDQRPDRRLIRRPAEIGLHEPGLAAARPGIIGLEHRRRGFARLEALGDEVGDGAGAALVADEAHLMRGVVGRQAFEHGDRLSALKRS